MKILTFFPNVRVGLCIRQENQMVKIRNTNAVLSRSGTRYASYPCRAMISCGRKPDIRHNTNHCKGRILLEYFSLEPPAPWDRMSGLAPLDCRQPDSHERFGNSRGDTSRLSTPTHCPPYQKVRNRWAEKSQLGLQKYTRPGSDRDMEIHPASNWPNREIQDHFPMDTQNYPSRHGQHIPILLQ